MFWFVSFQAHFEDACFKNNAKRRRLQCKNALPTICAFTLNSDDEPPTDFFKSRPLYSSPALHDHNYANFVAVVAELVEVEDKESRNAEIESVNDMRKESVKECCVTGDEDDVASVSNSEAQKEEQHVLAKEMNQEVLQKRYADENSQLASVEVDSDDDVVKEKQNSFRLFR